MALDSDLKNALLDLKTLCGMITKGMEIKCMFAIGAKLEEKGVVERCSVDILY